MTVIPNYKLDTGAYFTMLIGGGKNYERIGIDTIMNKWVYNIRSPEIITWVEEQNIHMWKYYHIPRELIPHVSKNVLFGSTYIFTEEMESWFLLKWS